MSKTPHNAGEQIVSNGQVKIDGEWRSIRHDHLVQLESGEWVAPEKAENLTQHLAKRRNRTLGETPETAKHPLTDQRGVAGKPLGNSGNTSPLSIEELEEKAAPILALDDPLVRFEESVRGIGFGGQTEPVKIVYLAGTSRVLAMEPGNMPVHTGLQGTTGSGKTYTLDTALDHLPPESIYEVDAGSPRVLIYGQTDLRHKVIKYSEADSIPGIRQRGDDDDFNPAGSAFRILLQDHHLAYDFVDMKAQGGPKVVHIVREGPSVLLTTYTKRLPDQIDSRLFTVAIPEDMAQIRAALSAQGLAEVAGRGKPDEGLIAYQSLLQAKAPWRVVVPFAQSLSHLIADRPSAPRIMRDFQRILSLTKSVAVIRHHHRLVDARGYLVARIEDYETVYDLIGDMYETTAGVSPAVRETVETVKALDMAGDKSITATKVAERLGIGKKAATGRIRAALSEGWLLNSETRRGYPWCLQIGEPVPSPVTLPSPGSLGSVSRHFPSVSLEADEETSTGCFAVSPVSGGSATSAIGTVDAWVV